MTKEELRVRVEAELLSGLEPQELSTKYSVPYVTILGWKKKLLAEKSTVEISELSGQTMGALEIIRQKAKEQAPKVAGKIDTIIDGVQGLKELEPSFHAALQKSVMVAKAFLDRVDDDGKSDLTIKEWQVITSTLAGAYSALFNKGGTTVNVAQTNVNAQAENLSFFKASQKKM